MHNITCYIHSIRLIPFRYTKLIESKSTEEGIILGNIHFHMASIYRYKRMYKQSECSACSALDHRKLYTGIFIVYICMSKCMPSNSLYWSFVTTIKDDEHPDVAQSMNFLACLRLERNVIDSTTEAMFLEALRIAEVRLSDWSDTCIHTYIIHACM